MSDIPQINNTSHKLKVYSIKKKIEEIQKKLGIKIESFEKKISDLKTQYTQFFEEINGELEKVNTSLKVNNAKNGGAKLSKSKKVKATKPKSTKSKKVKSTKSKSSKSKK